MATVSIMKIIFLLLFLFGGTGTICFAQNSEKVVCNGIPWFDNNGDIVNAHGACIVEGIIFSENGNPTKATLSRGSLAIRRMIW